MRTNPIHSLFFLVGVFLCDALHLCTRVSRQGVVSCARMDEARAHRHETQNRRSHQSRQKQAINFVSNVPDVTFEFQASRQSTRVDHLVPSLAYGSLARAADTTTIPFVCVSPLVRVLHLYRRARQPSNTPPPLLQAGVRPLHEHPAQRSRRSWYRARTTSTTAPAARSREWKCQCRIRGHFHPRSSR